MFTTIPVGNKVMPIGTQYGILSDVNISRERFVDDYKNKLIT